MFHWIRSAFGDKMGVTAVWVQWINTMVWYPTMLLFIAGTVAHLISHTMIGSNVFLVSISLLTFWSLTLINLYGLQVSVRINSLCGTIGTLIPMFFLIFLALWWIFSSKSLAIPLTLNKFIPNLSLLDSSSAIVTIMASFLGMELAGVHIGDIHDPKKNFPKAIYLSISILLSTLILGSLSIAIVIPPKDIHFVDGVMQTLITFLNAFNLSFLVPLMAVLIIIGATGGSVNWLLSPAKGLLQVAQEGFLPPFFSVENKHKVASRLLIFQAIVVSIFCFAIHFIPNVNTFYWFLMALSTGLYMLVYVLLFLAALKLRRPASGYKIPKGFRTLFCLMGLGASVVTIFIGFLPPPDVTIDTAKYSISIGLGFGLMILPAFLLIKYKKSRKVLESQN